MQLWPKVHISQVFDETTHHVPVTCNRKKHWYVNWSSLHVHGGATPFWASRASNADVPSCVSEYFWNLFIFSNDCLLRFSRAVLQALSWTLETWSSPIAQFRFSMSSPRFIHSIFAQARMRNCLTSVRSVYPRQPGRFELPFLHVGKELVTSR